MTDDKRNDPETQAIDMIEMFKSEGYGYPAEGTAEAEAEPVWSRWVHYCPTLVDTMTAHAGVPEVEVIEHLGHITEEVHAAKAAPLQTDSEVLRRYLNQFVAVG